MRHRQITATQWLIIRNCGDRQGLEAATRLPRGGGILLLEPIAAADMRRLRQVARAKELTIIVERPDTAARVHNLRELRAALLRRTPLILLSPLYPTRSHPDWAPIPHMRAAAFARLSGRKLVALGGMDGERYRKVARLGFSGWAGVSAFRT